MNAYFQRIFTISIKDFTFFYEKAIQDLDIQIRFKISIYKCVFWLSFFTFYGLSFGLPYLFYDTCETRISHKIFYIFIGVAFFLTLIEFTFIYPLVKNMYEIPRKTFNEFPLSWFFKLFLSLLLKGNFLTDFVVLIYGRNCFHN